MRESATGRWIGISRITAGLICRKTSGFPRRFLRSACCWTFCRTSAAVWSAPGSGQGNRTSEQSEEPSEIVIIPSGAHELCTQRPFCDVLLHDVQRHVAQHGEIVWGVVEASSVVILVHDHVQPPVQLVLHTPMRAHDLVEAFRR